MSHVTNVLLTCEIDDQGVHRLNEALAGRGVPVLGQVVGEAGGDKSLEADIWTGAFNCLDLDAFIADVRAAPWEAEENVRLLVQEQDENSFHQIHL